MRTILLAAILAIGAAAQNLTEPPPLIRVIRRLGIDTATIRRYSDSGAAVHVFGMTSVTGLTETWLIEAHNSFASVEDVDKAVRVMTPVSRPDALLDQPPDEGLVYSRSLLALYRPRWSYRPDQAIRMFAKARYFYVSIHRIRLGAEADFGEVVKLRRAWFDSMNLDRPDLVYQVISGAPSGMYLFLAPLTSLAALDEGLARAPVYAEPVAKAGHKAVAEGEISREYLLFRVEPEMSHVSEDFASADPEFWKQRAKPR